LEKRFSAEEVQRLWNLLADRDEQIDSLTKERDELEKTVGNVGSLAESMELEITSLKQQLSESQEKVKELEAAIKARKEQRHD
jgi:peptidoglycan hydrolase CwlO-like protein